MKHTPISFILATLLCGLFLPVAKAETLEQMNERQFQYAVDSYMKRVEDLRSLAINEGKDNQPISTLKDQALDGSDKSADLPKWFVEWHAASLGGAQPRTPKALEAKRRAQAAAADRGAVIDSSLTTLIKKVIGESGSGLGPQRVVCDGPSGSCASVATGAFLEMRVSGRAKNPYSAGGAGAGMEPGEGTGMSPVMDGQ